MPGRSRKEGGTDARWGEKGEKGRGIYACIAMHHPSFVRETKGHHRVRYLSCFAYRHLNAPWNSVRAHR